MIGAYNRVTRVEDLLEANGYKQRGKKWLSPYSSSGAPGVSVFDEGKVYVHHASDPLGDGYAHDAFDLFLMFEHGGNLAAALAAASGYVGARVVREPDHARELRGVDPALLERWKAGDYSTTDRRKSAPAPVIHIAHVENLVMPPAAPAPVVDDLSFKVLDRDLLEAPGFVKRTMDWMLSTAPMPQPILAFVATLSLGGLMLGRKVCSGSGLRTNQMLISVAPTGAGKDHPRKALRQICSASGNAEMVGPEDIASGAAVLAMLAQKGNVVCQIDEFGLFLEGSMGKTAGSHERGIAAVMMKAFSAAQGTLGGKARADTTVNPAKDIEYPCLHLHGTTTSETLFKALRSEQTVSGYLNRMLVFFAPERLPQFQHGIGLESVPIPADLLDWCRAVRTMAQGMAGLQHSSPIVMRPDAWADQKLRAFKEVEQAKMQPGAGPLGVLWARATEAATKMAMVFACSRHTAAELKEFAASGQLVIDGASAERAIIIVTQVLDEMTRQISTRMSDSDVGAIYNEVRLKVEATGERGQTAYEICRVSPLFRSLLPDMRDKILKGLQDSGDIQLVISIPGGRGRPRNAYVSTKFVRQEGE